MVAVGWWSLPDDDSSTEETSGSRQCVHRRRVFTSPTKQEENRQRRLSPNKIHCDPYSPELLQPHLRTSTKTAMVPVTTGLMLSPEPRAT